MSPSQPGGFVDFAYRLGANNKILAGRINDGMHPFMEAIDRRYVIDLAQQTM